MNHQSAELVMDHVQIALAIKVEQHALTISSTIVSFFHFTYNIFQQPLDYEIGKNVQMDNFILTLQETELHVQQLVIHFVLTKLLVTNVIQENF